ncbi:MAG TPA: hypothetical protein VFR46_01095 [Actinomycetes bacterium]|nr:hypothetical protein [Actinomycetes bacterium]
MVSTPKSKSDAELVILQETQPKALAELSEDDLLDLHKRVRRARNKHVGKYRRKATARVAESGARGASHQRNQRARDRAEVFEVALARVSSALATAARRSAAELKAERLAAARGEPFVPPGGPRTERQANPPRKRPPKKSSGRLKKDASSISQGARRQAKRDSR